jgi:hypothetical protein
MYLIVLFYSFVFASICAAQYSAPGGLTATFDIKTSHIPDSGTEGPIYAVLNGDNAASQMFELGGFARGSSVQRSVELDKTIGELQSISFFTNSTDGWQLNSIICELDGKRHCFPKPSMWLDAFDLELFQEFGDGYSKEYVRDSQESITLPVATP